MGMRSLDPLSLRHRRLKNTILVIVIAFVCVWLIATLFPRQPYTIVVNGNPVATVASRRTAEAVLERAQTKALPALPRHLTRLNGTIELRASNRGSSVLGVPEAVRAVQEAAPVEAEVYAVMVDGTPTVALVSKKDAEKTLQLVKEKYVPKKAKLHSEPTFKEAVRIERMFVNANLVEPSPSAAALALTTVSGEPVVHIVRHGDRAIKIAEKYATTLDRLKALNPDKDLDRITEGDEILVHKPATPVTVVHRVVETRVVTVNAPAGARQARRGRTGEREIRSLKTYENGELAGEEIISQVTTWK